MNKIFAMFLMVLMSATAASAYDVDIDLSSLISNPTPVDMGPLGTYDLYLQNWLNGSTVVTVTGVSGGDHIVVVIPDIEADILLDKTCTWSMMFPVECTGPDSITGKLTMSSIIIEADVIECDLQNIQVYINDFDVVFDGLIGDVFDPVFEQMMMDLVADMENEFANQLHSMINCDEPAIPEFSLLSGVLVSSLIMFYILRRR